MEISKKQTILILIILIIIQVVARIYIGSKKEYFHMDEMYSYGLMNYDKLNITDNTDFLNNWHAKEYYQDYLEVNRGEVGNWRPVYENQKNDVHPPLYYLLLRGMASFTIDYFTKWTGIILNILIFCVSTILVYLIGKRLFQSRIYALLLCLINGFTLISLESSIYIRMYELTNLFVLAIAYFHLKLWKKEEMGWKEILPLTIFWILGGLTHYYFFLFAAGLYMVTLYRMVRKKRYMAIWKYHLGILVAGFSYLVIFPYAIGHVFGGYRGIGGAIGIIEYGVKALGYLSLINQKFLNGFLLILLFILGILTLSLWKRRNIKKDTNTDIVYFILPVFLYFVIVVKNAPFIDIRYIIPIYSILTILMIHGVKTFFVRYWDNKTAIFMTVLIFLLITYSPVLTGTKIQQTYQKYNGIAKKLEKLNLPILYVFNPSANRFLDDIYLFTLVDKSIIMQGEGLTEEKFKETVDDADTYILICNERTDEKKIKSWISGKIDYMQRMNACNIYQIMK